MIVAGTGHRPKYMPCQYDEQHEWALIIKDQLKEQLQEMKITKVISGMAIGWDIALARAAINLEIPVVCAIPFKGQEAMWPEESQNTYNLVLSLAESVNIICEGGYEAWKMQKRNQWMVDGADTILALWDGTPGGTKNCINYAIKSNKTIINLYDNFLNFNIKN